jgi:hypothetical protein
MFENKLEVIFKISDSSKTSCQIRKNSFFTTNCCFKKTKLYFKIRELKQYSGVYVIH